jgi:NADPH:quinone reductase-like Zn-dependent oxidoreductase
MARGGEYKLSSGDPPFTPGLEGGGIIEAVGPGVTQRKPGQRVILSVDTSRKLGGTYRSHYVCPADQTLLAPDAIPNEQLGAIWLTHLTAWGCLIWKQDLKAGQFVAISAASSGVGLAAAQIVRAAGAIAIGLTSHPEKVPRISAASGGAFHEIIVTHENGVARPWHQDLKRITQGHGVDVFFDAVGAGEYLNSEIRGLAQGGTIWVYGLLSKVGPVDVSPLIRKHAAIRGWLLGELYETSPEATRRGCQAILDGFAKGTYRQHIDRTFPLDQVAAAHEYMERAKHVGKLILVP